MSEGNFTKDLIELFEKKKKSSLPSTQKLFDHLKQLPSAKVDEVFHENHEAVFAQVDCLQCANCCKTISPIITQKDIDEVSSHLGITPSKFLQQYLEMDEDGDFVFKSTPCPFLLSDNRCRIYEHRPRACREYPHTNRRKMKQILDITLLNTSSCPAVWKIVESVKSSLSGK